MELVVVSILLVLVVALIGAIVSLNKRRYYFLLLACPLVLATSIAGYKVYERSFHLSFVPDALGVSSITYTKEESWSFGPGGNEAGITLYRLPDSTAEQIEKLGIGYFLNLPPNYNQQSRRWRGLYKSWSATPIREDRRWRRSEGELQVYDYVCRYGFCISIDRDVLTQVTGIINSEGSYYAYGRVGAIVVSPSNRLVVYLYNG